MVKNDLKQVPCESQKLLFDFKQTSIAEIHLCFQGYVTVSCVTSYITMDEGTFIHGDINSL
jgi:hypothetical protein